MPDREYHVVSINGHDHVTVDVRYTNLKPIGGGSYGTVYSADDSVTGGKVAIKKISDTFADLIDAKRILREIKLLHHFNHHENVVSLFDIMTDPPNDRDFDAIYIVTNLMESDLDRILSSPQSLTEQHFQYFLYQILRGLKYVHSANVLHRDLKPSNLLVNANCDLAICDFGLARGVISGEYSEGLTEYVVTRWYRAPELLCNCPGYGKEVDIWSVGCILAEMLCRQPFFQGRNPHNQLEMIVRVLGVPSEEDMDFVEHQTARKAILSQANRPTRKFSSFFPRDTSPEAIDLLEKMLRFHPDKRITVEEALEHEYLKDFHGQMPEPTCRRRFDFGFEMEENDGSKMDEDSSTRNLSKHELQNLMYDEMLELIDENEGGDDMKIDRAEGKKSYEDKDYYDDDKYSHKK